MKKRLLAECLILIVVVLIVAFLTGCGAKIPFPSRIPIPNKIPIGWP